MGILGQPLVLETDELHLSTKWLLLSNGSFGRITFFLACDVISGRSVVVGVFHSAVTARLVCHAVVTFYAKKPFPLCAICARSPQEQLPV